MFVGPFWWAYLRGGLSAVGGTYTRNKKMFSEKMIQNSQFASLKSKSNIIFDNNLTNNYL